MKGGTLRVENNMFVFLPAGYWRCWRGWRELSVQFDLVGHVGQHCGFGVEDQFEAYLVVMFWRVSTWLPMRHGTFKSGVVCSDAAHEKWSLYKCVMATLWPGGL
jgi:hypothetical protein